MITREEWLGWEILIDRFHYLRHRPIVGEHLRYAAYLEGQVVACLAWASAALRCPTRDRFIGWDDATRKRRLPDVVNNTRFLILPWIRVPHLASKILGTNLRRLHADWQQTWGHGLVLAETFVDAARFQGNLLPGGELDRGGDHPGTWQEGQPISPPRPSQDGLALSPPSSLATAPDGAGALRLSPPGPTRPDPSERSPNPHLGGNP